MVLLGHLCHPTCSVTENIFCTMLYVYDSGVRADFTLRLAKPKCNSSSTFSRIQLSDYYDTEMCMKSKIIN